MIYVSIDIETTGLTPEHHNILQFAAVLDDLSVQAPLTQLPTFRAYLLPPDERGYTGDPYALQMNAKILETIANREGRDGRWQGRVKPRFLHPGEFMHEFVDWAERQGLSTNKKPTRPGIYATEATSPKHIKFVPAGKNVAGFDLPFLKTCIPRWSEMRVSHRALDPAMLYFDPRRDSVPPSLATCLKRAGLPTTVTHDAVDDARQVIQLIRHKFPVDQLAKTCQCDGGGSLMHARSPDCTSGQPVEPNPGRDV